MRPRKKLYFMLAFLCPSTGANPQGPDAELASMAPAQSAGMSRRENGRKREEPVKTGREKSRKGEEHAVMPTCPAVGVDTGAQIIFVPCTEPVRQNKT